MLDVLGPFNASFLLALLCSAVGAVVDALRRVHRGDVVRGLPLVLALALPLGFAVWAASGQLPGALADAMAHEPARDRQLMMYLAMRRSILTQLVAGAGVAVTSGVVLIGVLRLTVRGERPRARLAVIGSTIGAVLVAVAAAAAPSGSVLALRALLYALAVGAAVAAIRGAHRRGPGVQLGTVSGLVLPLLIVGADQAAVAWIAGAQLDAIAVAPPAAKQAIMDELVGSVGTMRAFSGAHLGLAAGLAILGPVAAWRSDRSLAVRHLAALSAGVVLAGVGIGWASTWLVGF